MINPLVIYTELLTGSLLAKLDDLVWVQCKLLSQLSQRLIPFQSGYRHLGSKLGRKRSSWSSHRRAPWRFAPP